MIAIMSDWQTLFDGASTRVHAAGGTLFRRDDPVHEVHLCRSGTILLERTVPDGARLALARIGAGGLVAEASLTAAVYHCDAVVRHDALVASLPRATFLSALVDRPDACLALLGAVAAKLQRARAQTEILRLRRLSDRLDAWLDLSPPPAAGGWRGVADAIGVTPAALYRELARRRHDLGDPAAMPET